MGIMEEKVELLEKENAELKEQVFILAERVAELEKALENQKKYAKGLKSKVKDAPAGSKVVQH